MPLVFDVRFCMMRRNGEEEEGLLEMAMIELIPRSGWKDWR